MIINQRVQFSIKHNESSCLNPKTKKRLTNLGQSVQTHKNSPFLRHAHDLFEQPRHASELVHVDGYQDHHGVTNHHRPESLQDPTPHVVTHLRGEEMDRVKQYLFSEATDFNIIIGRIFSNLFYCYAHCYLIPCFHI